MSCKKVFFIYDRFKFKILLKHYAWKFYLKLPENKNQQDRNCVGWHPGKIQLQRFMTHFKTSKLFLSDLTTTSKEIPRQFHRMARTSLAMNLVTSQRSSEWNSQLHFQVHYLIANFGNIQTNFGNRLSKGLWNAL